MLLRGRASKSVGSVLSVSQSVCKSDSSPLSPHPLTTYRTKSQHQPTAQVSGDIHRRSSSGRRARYSSLRAFFLLTHQTTALLATRLQSVWCEASRRCRCSRVEAAVPGESLGKQRHLKPGKQSKAKQAKASKQASKQVTEQAAGLEVHARAEQ